MLNEVKIIEYFICNTCMSFIMHGSHIVGRPLPLTLTFLLIKYVHLISVQFKLMTGPQLLLFKICISVLLDLGSDLISHKHVAISVILAFQKLGSL